MSLSEIRKEIDRIDTDLVELLKERMSCSKQVAEIKKAEGLPIYHPQREAEILERVKAQGGNFGEEISAIYGEILKISKEIQK